MPGGPSAVVPRILSTMDTLFSRGMESLAAVPPGNLGADEVFTGIPDFAYYSIPVFKSLSQLHDRSGDCFLLLFMIREGDKFSIRVRAFDGKGQWLGGRDDQEWIGNCFIFDKGEHSATDHSMHSSLVKDKFGELTLSEGLKREQKLYSKKQGEYIKIWIRITPNGIDEAYHFIVEANSSFTKLTGEALMTGKYNFNIDEVYNAERGPETMDALAEAGRPDDFAPIFKKDEPETFVRAKVDVMVSFPPEKRNIETMEISEIRLQRAAIFSQLQRSDTDHGARLTSSMRYDAARREKAARVQEQEPAREPEHVPAREPEQVMEATRQAEQKQLRTALMAVRRHFTQAEAEGALSKRVAEGLLTPENRDIVGEILAERWRRPTHVLAAGPPVGDIDLPVRPPHEVGWLGSEGDRQEDLLAAPPMVSGADEQGGVVPPELGDLFVSEQGEVATLAAPPVAMGSDWTPPGFVE